MAGSVVAKEIDFIVGPVNGIGVDTFIKATSLVAVAGTNPGWMNVRAMLKYVPPTPLLYLVPARILAELDIDALL